MSRIIRIVASQITPELKKTHYIKKQKDKHGVVRIIYATPKETSYTPRVRQPETNPRQPYQRKPEATQKFEDIKRVKETFRKLLKDKRNLKVLQDTLNSLLG